MNMFPDLSILKATIPISDEVLNAIDGVGEVKKHPAQVELEKLLTHSDNQRVELARLNRDVETIPALKLNIRSLERQLANRRQENATMSNMLAKKTQELDNLASGQARKALDDVLNSTATKELASAMQERDQAIRERDEAIKTQIPTLGARLVLLYQALLSGLTMMQLVDKTKRPAWMEGLEVLTVGINNIAGKGAQTWGSFRFRIGDGIHDFEHQWVAPGTPIDLGSRFHFGSTLGEAPKAKAA